MGEVGTEEVLVHSKCLSSFLGEIRVLPTRYPFGPAAHLAGLGLAGVSRICAGPCPSPFIPTPSQSALASRLPGNPGPSGRVSSGAPN